MGFFRLEYWNGSPFPPLGDFPNQGIEPMFPALQVDSLSAEPSGKTVQFSSVQSLSGVQFFATPWTAAGQAFLSITKSWSLPKLMSIKSLMPSNHLISSVMSFSSCLQSFPASGSFPMSQFFASGGQSIGVSVSASVLAMNIQDRLPLGLTGLISLQSLSKL